MDEVLKQHHRLLQSMRKTSLFFLLRTKLT
ncbi:D-amino acid dehydrogenase small subunit [Marinobacter sp. ELB17]|nr:D-amino acid dehydrogenase small subunit [Marinobacter sp. ELB17]